MFTKKMIGASMLVALAAVNAGCVASSDSSLDDEIVDNKEDGVGAASVFTTLGAALTQADTTNEAIKDGKLLAALGSLAGFAAFFPSPDGYAEISPAQIEQIATDTAKKVMAQSDKTNMANYVANSKGDLTTTRTQVKSLSCTPGAAGKDSTGKFVPHCTSAQLTNAHDTANALFNELTDDWSDMTSLRKKSPALAMTAAKTIVLVGAARIFLDHRLQVIDQMTNQTSLYESNHSHKITISVPNSSYRSLLKKEMSSLYNNFEPALDNIYTTKVVDKKVNGQRSKYGCVSDQNDNETCDTEQSHRSDYDCDWELGCVWDQSPSDKDLLGYAVQVREGLQNGIRPAKQSAWLGVGQGFWTQYDKL